MQTYREANGRRLKIEGFNPVVSSLAIAKEVGQHLLNIANRNQKQDVFTRGSR